MIVEFENLKGSDLVVDAIYKGGIKGNTGDDPISKLFPKLGNMSGFRKVKRSDDDKKLAYVVLYTSMSELEWPDYLDVETGVFRYYGDNRKAGNELTKTKQGGNKLLEEVFGILNSGKNLDDIPPFFVFKKGDKGRDVQFLGLAAPGNPNISPDKDLVAFWRTMGNNRFQNYEAYFTILDTKNEAIKYEWLEALLNDHSNNLAKAPKVPHFINGKIITTAKETVNVIKTVVNDEFERRAKILSDVRAKNIIEYNQKSDIKLPPIVIIIDEFADIADQLSNKKEREEFYTIVRRIVQIGCKRGIHMVLCTQRPSANLVPTAIKAQLTARLALRVTDATSSRMIIDETGAQNLQKHGDLIFKSADGKIRAQGYNISTDEVDEIVSKLI